MAIRYYIILSFCWTQYVTAKQDGSKIPDSLHNKSYDYLFERLQNRKTGIPQRSFYMKVFLQKAKQENNWTELSEGYKNYVHYAPEKLRLVYADSMVNAAKQTKDNEIIGSAYLSKGIAYYNEKKLIRALDLYLVANTYISKTDNKFLIYKAKYNIGQIKHLLGYYNEAIILFKECIEFLKDDDVDGYLSSLHALGLCYNKAGNFGMCSTINKKGIKESNTLGYPNKVPYFILSQGVNNCDIHNYAIAIKEIEASLPGIPNTDFGNKTVGYFHLGKSCWMLGKEDKAVYFFKKVHEAFIHKRYIRPDLREAYELMIDYYKRRNNTKMQLYYIEILLKVDENLYTTFYHLQGKIVKEYDTKKLREEKNKIERSLAVSKHKELIFIAIIFLLVGLTLGIIIWHRRSRKALRKKYEELVTKLEIAKQPKVKDEENLTINEDAVTKILRQLEKFEQSKKYLEKDLGMTKLAALFDTNTTYLSKIIFHHRGKRFPEYINDLKIDTIAQRIKDEKVLRKYSNKALAEEAGFTSTPRFVSAFSAKTGITPTFFIEQLVKDEVIKQEL